MSRIVIRPGKAAALAVAFSAAVACSPGRAAPPREIVGVDGRPLAATAFVDTRTGQIVLPLDRLMATEQQRYVVEHAVDLLLADCMREAGFTFVVVDRRSVVPPPSRRYGVWAASAVTTDGYIVPSADPATRRREQLNATPLPAAAQRRFDECVRRPDVRAFAAHDMGVQLSVSDTYNAVLDSPEGSAVLQEWRACLRSHGVSDRPSVYGPFHPEGATLTRSEADRRIATIDVRCKVETDLVQRLADLEATRQWEMVQRDPAAAQRQVDHLRAMLDRAAVVIAAH